MNDFGLLIGNLIVTIVAMVTCGIFTIIIYDVKFKIKPFILFVITSSVLSYGFLLICTALKIYEFKVFINFFAPVLLLYYFLKVPLVRCMISLGIFILLQGIGNAVVLALFSMYGIQYENAITDLKMLFYAHVIMNIINISVCIIIKSFKLIPNLPKEIKAKTYRISIINIFFVTVILAANFSYYTEGSHLKSTAFLFNVFLVVCYFVFSIYNINTLFKLEVKSQELEYQQFYNKTLETLMGDLRRFKHNFNNMLAVISAYAQVKRWDELMEYIQEIAHNNNQSESINEIMLLNVKNAAIMGILTAKIGYAKEKGVQIKINVENEIKEVNMKISELCEILGILLDNAIEAALDSEGKYVKACIRNVEGSISFSIENSVKELPNIHKIYEKNYSTKGENRGIGLWILNSIVHKYSNVMLNTFSEGNQFRQDLIVS